MTDDNLPFTTKEDNEAIISMPNFQDWIYEHCPAMDGFQFHVLLDTCTCPHCETPLILLLWIPYPRDENSKKITFIEKACWQDNPLPKSLPRALPIVVNGQKKQVCINHSKGER